MNMKTINIDIILILSMKYNTYYFTYNILSRVF